MHPGGANVLYAESVGMHYPTFQIQSTETLPEQPGKMQLKYSLAFTVKRYYCAHNTSASKSALLRDGKRPSGPPFRANSAKYPMPNQRGWALDITAPTTPRDIVASRRKSADFLWLRFNRSRRSVKRVGNVSLRVWWIRWRKNFIYCLFLSNRQYSETNIIAMRLGPGKHLKGRTLMGGLVKPSEFDYFHEVCKLSNWLPESTLTSTLGDYPYGACEI